MVTPIRYATAFSDFVLVLCCVQAIYNVRYCSVFAMLSFTIIGSAASLGVVKFGTGKMAMYHEKLSNIAASLAMPLILTAIIRSLQFHEVYQGSLVLTAGVVTLTGKRAYGEMLAGFCILCLIGISVAFRIKLLAVACALYVVSAVLLNFKTVMGFISTTDLFHYLISVAIILFSLILSEK